LLDLPSRAVEISVERVAGRGGAAGAGGPVVGFSPLSSVEMVSGANFSIVPFEFSVFFSR
jgi:hypothetical protein